MRAAQKIWSILLFLYFIPYYHRKNENPAIMWKLYISLLDLVEWILIITILHFCTMPMENTWQLYGFWQYHYLAVSCKSVAWIVNFSCPAYMATMHMYGIRQKKNQSTWSIYQSIQCLYYKHPVIERAIISCSVVWLYEQRYFAKNISS